MSKTAVFVAAAIAAAAVRAFAPNEDNKKETKSYGNVQDENSAIERRLERILSGVKGAGEVEVMVVFKDDGRENIAMNREYQRDGEMVKSDETAVLTSGKNAVIVQKNLPGVQGVIVTAQGAGDETVKEKLKSAVAAALPVAYHRIEVLEKEYKE